MTDIAFVYQKVHVSQIWDSETFLCHDVEGDDDDNDNNDDA